MHRPLATGRLALFCVLLLVMAVAAHVVIIPFPIPGHYLPISTFARSLASCCSSDGREIRVTLIFTESVAQKWEQQQKLQGRDGDDRVQIVAVSDGMPLDYDRSANYAVFLPILQGMGPAIKKCLEELQASCPISCLICDPYFPWMEDMARLFSLPLFLFFTDSAAVVSVLLHTRRLISNGLIGHGSDEKAHHVVVENIPGVPALPARALPFPPKEMEFLFDLRAKAETLMQSASGLLINTFCELEEEAMDFIHRYLSKPVLAIGPCVPDFMVSGGAAGGGIEAGAAGGRTAEGELMQWLDAHEAASVMYVSFGSLVILPDVLIQEVWEGLRASNQPFLWATRSELAKTLATERAGAMEMEMEKGKGKGKVVEWAPQQRVLSHPAVGGFLTHCGWNAALEGITGGVPMLCCPQFMDQLLTSALVAQEWRMGLQLGASPDRATVERHVRLILLEEEGKSLRQRASKLREAAISALRHAPVGSSIGNLQSLIKLLL